MNFSKPSQTVLFLACSLSGFSGFGQPNQVSSCGVPLVVTHFNPSVQSDELVRGLTGSDLKIQLGSDEVSTASAEIDDAPKRVVIVLDDASQMSQQEWRLQTEMAIALVERARDRDRFALVFVSSGRDAIPFRSAKEIREQLKQSASSRPTPSASARRTLAALLAATQLFDPPLFGDTVFLFGHDAESAGDADLKQLREVLLRNGIGFLALSLVSPFENVLPRGTNVNKPLSVPFGQSKLATLSAATGWSFSYTSMKVMSEPRQVSLRKEHLAFLYSGIAAPYRISVPASSIRAGAPLKIAVKNVSEREITDREMHYPRVVYPCMSPNTK